MGVYIMSQQSLTLAEKILNTDKQEKLRKIINDYSNNVVCSYNVIKGSAHYIFALSIVVLIFTSLILIQVSLGGSISTDDKYIVYGIAGFISILSTISAFYHGSRAYNLTLFSYINELK